MRYREKPITLYVSPDGVSETERVGLGIEMERIIDIELSEQDAIKLKGMLVEKLSVEVFGAVTFRLQGRLVI